MDPRKVEIKDYTYDLPQERIAQFPLEERDSSKLLVYKGGKIKDAVYRNIADYLPSNALMVFNDTKVVQARLHFKNQNGARIEIFCLEPAEANIELTSAMLQKKTVLWKCMVGKAAKWKSGKLEIEKDGSVLSAEKISKDSDAFTIRFEWEPENLSFAEILEAIGDIPIPPYLKRASEDLDENRYQTVYAKEKGSVAAPTAGLHFTELIFERLAEKQIEVEYVTLHVGAGTFKPVKSETIEAHEMHAEWIDVPMRRIEKMLHTLEQQKPIVAVGTTSLRTIESLYWMGVKAQLNPKADIQQLTVQQWDAYELPQDVSAEDALSALLKYMKGNRTERLTCQTQLLVAPPYQLKMADALVTNYHQPQSTLLLLVASVVGENWRKIYQHAMENDYRFLSYGDGSLLFKS